MPSKLGIALLGMTFGGVTFLITGLAVFLSISQLQDRTIVDARATTAKAMIVHYAQLPPPR
jgi:hypothetical protein